MQLRVYSQKVVPVAEGCECCGLFVCCVERVGILHPEVSKGLSALRQAFHTLSPCSALLAGSSACLLVAGPSPWSCGFPAQGLIGEDIQSLHVFPWEIWFGDPDSSPREFALCSKGAC